MQNKYLAYELAKRNLKNKLNATCKTSGEWQEKYNKEIKKIINLLNL